MAFTNVVIHGAVDQDDNFTHNEPNDLFAVQFDIIESIDHCPAVLIQEQYLQNILRDDNNNVHINPSSTIIVTLDDNSEITIDGNILIQRFNTANSAFVIDVPINITPQQIQSCYVPWMSLFISKINQFLTFIPLRNESLSPIKYEFINFSLINANTGDETPIRNFTITIGESSEPDPDPPTYNTNDFLTTTQINKVLGAGGIGVDFKKKSELIELGADETLMTSFGINDFIPGKYIKQGTYDTVYDVINSLKSGVINFSLFDGNNHTEDPAIGYVFNGENTNNAQFDAGFEGGGRKRKAWKAGNGNYIQLNPRATTTVTSQLTVSIVFKQTQANSNVTGLFGGVIYGNGHWGLGYGCGWRPSQQSNKIGFEVYSGTGNNDGAATICYSNVAPELNKWYHLVVNARLSGGYIYMYMWLNGVKTSGYSAGHNTTIGYQSLVDQTQTDKICLGRVQQSGWNLFHGMIQDFVLWNKALSDTDIQKIINYYKGQGMF